MSFLTVPKLSCKAFLGSGCHFSRCLSCAGGHFRDQNVTSHGLCRVIEGMSGLRMSFLRMLAITIFTVLESSFLGFSTAPSDLRIYSYIYYVKVPCFSPNGALTLYGAAAN